MGPTARSRGASGHADVNAGAQHRRMELAAILELYALEGRGTRLNVGMNRVQHAWQCARLARNAGAAPSLQLAAWLHEMGEMRRGLHDPEAGLAGEGHAVAPARQGAAWLEPLFGAAVAEPVALQAAARRCLASTKPDFRRRIPAGWLAQIERDGGLQTPREARLFLQRSYAPQAIRLCLWDADAHDPGLWPPSLESALDTLRRLMWLLQTAAPLPAAVVMPRAGVGRRLTARPLGS
jgi:predicted HD phosphohydrolase